MAVKGAPSAFRRARRRIAHIVGPTHALGPMSALGQKQTFALQNVVSALPPKADMCSAQGDVRLVPIADITRAAALTE